MVGAAFVVVQGWLSMLCSLHWLVTHHLAQERLQLTILLPQTPNYLDYKYVSPYPALFYFSIDVSFF